LLRERDRPFFLRCVQNPDATKSPPDISKLDGSQKRIAESLVYLRSQLEELSEDRRNALIAFIIQRCYLVVVAVPTPEAARRIFTVLNARGLDLAPTDILKADILDRAGPAREAALAARWEEVEDALGREKMVELFGHVRMIYEWDKPRLALEIGFPKFVPPFAGDAENFLSEIVEPFSDALLLLSDPGRAQKHFGIEAAKAIKSLNRIDNKDWVPPALLRVWKWRQDDSSAVAKYLIDLERLAYFLFVTRAGVNDRIERFAGVMDEFQPRPGRDISSIGLVLTDAEQYEFVKALSGPLYPMTRVCKPVLQRLDEGLSSGGATYDELVSIEYVLPQTVEEASEWASLFPDEQQRSEWTHRLANLVFLTHRINTRASNWSFEKKKKEYFASSDGSSPFVITQGVLRTEKWTPEHLRERQAELLEKLCEVWQLTVSEFIELAEPDQKLFVARQATDDKLIEAKRTEIMSAFSQREGIALSKKGALYWSADQKMRAVCTISKRYVRRTSPYWYGYSLDWQKFLLEAKKSCLILGCMDKNTAYVLPAEEIEKNLPNLHRTQDRHWHIVLDEDQGGSLRLVPKNGPKLPLKKFELQITDV
jgi:Protein of unknown function (DUF1524)